MDLRTGILPTLLLLSACAAGPRLPGTASPSGDAAAHRAADASSGAPAVIVVETRAPDDGDLVCAPETLTGSHRKDEVCATRAERREQRRDAQEWLRSGGLRGGVSRVPTVR